MRRSWRIGVDTGGTFTDGVLWSEDGGEIFTAKIFAVGLSGDPQRLCQLTGAVVARARSLSITQIELNWAVMLRLEFAF